MAIFFSFVSIISIIVISYFYNFNIALSILLCIGMIYDVHIVLKYGIRKEDFTKKNIENMEPVGASALVWLIVKIIGIIVILYYIEPRNFIFY